MNTNSDEFSIKELLISFWKHRILFIVINTLFVIGSIAYSLITDEIYEVNCLIRPAQLSEEVTLQSSLFTQFSLSSGKMELPVAKEIASNLYSSSFLKKYYNDYKDSVDGIFEDHLIKISESDLEEPYKSELLFDTGIKILKNIIIMNDDGYSMTISVRHKNKYLAYRFLKFLISDLKSYIENENKKTLQDQIEFYTDIINNTNDPLIKNKLRSTINEKIRLRSLISSNILQIIEEPTIPAKKYWPRRSLIVITSSLLGFVFSIFFVTSYIYILNFVNSFRNKNQL